MFLLLLQQPIIVRVVEQPVHQTSLGDVILGALGAVVILLVVAAILGAMFGGILIGIKLLLIRFGRQPYSDHKHLHVTPTP
ncbi:MAG: hypothetical protein ACRD1V_04820 [Vicinamibacterales bacterium]